MAYFNEQVLEDPDLQVILSIRLGDRIQYFTGVLLAPVNFNGSATHSAKGSNILNAAQDAKEATSNALGASKYQLAQDTASNIEKMEFRNQNLTRKQWNGDSGEGNISVSFGMMNNRKYKNIFGDYYDLHALTYPTVNGDGALQAPHGYRVHGAGQGNSSGTWTVEIGKWFRADGMILQGVDINPSLILDQTLSIPSPIATSVTASFTYFKTPTADTVRKWYLGNKS